ncbi:GumC family protein [Massilia sp. DWR3-1-1]|uniref:GumC family protein n=1 Tax=Massilia sp. DWR3-1-1 TaxID=2804559 RepID=UPI003CEEE8D9
MNESQRSAEGPVRAADERGFDLIELLIIFAKYKRFIIGFPLTIAVIAAAVSLILPNVYISTTRLLPPQQAQSGAAALLSQLGGIASVAGSAAGIKNPNDVYIGMLKSRTLADRLITQFELLKVYDTKSMEHARKKLDENTTIISGKDGLIAISVEDEDQKLVAKLANGYVNQLTNLTTVLAVTEASQRRLFYERQLGISKDNLAASELKLKGALATSGVISVDSESRGILETVAKLRAQVSAKEIQLNSMRAFVTTNNPQYKVIAEDLSSLRNELNKLENGSSNSETDPRSDSTGLQNIKVLRDVKYNQMLYELLAKQYEVARLDEAKDPSLIQVLDQAIEPERKFKPKRALIVVVSALLASFLAIFLAIMFEVKARAMQVPQVAVRWLELRSHLKFKRSTKN